MKFGPMAGTTTAGSTADARGARPEATDALGSATKGEI
jgi:hypothetical protein